MVAILISDKIDLKTKAIVTDEVDYIMIKGAIQQEGITFAKMYSLNIGVPKYVKQILIDIKGGIDSNIVIVGYLNPLLTSMGRSSGKKINKETSALNDTLDKMDLIDFFRAFYSKAEYSIFLHFCIFIFKYILLIILLQLSHFFSPLLPSALHPSPTSIPHP